MSPTFSHLPNVSTPISRKRPHCLILKWDGIEDKIIEESHSNIGTKPIKHNI